MRTTSHQQYQLGQRNKVALPKVPSRAPVLARQKGSAPTVQQTIQDEAKYILQTYVRPEVVFVRGDGCSLYDDEGKKYLDFAAGIAVNCLGHSHPDWVAAVAGQARTLAHTSNLYHTVPQVELGKRLVESSFADKVFFCNSGTEANEAAMKFARKWAKVQAGADPYDGDAEVPIDLVSFSSGFHGRTYGALALTPRAKYQTPFGPMLDGASCADFMDLDSAAKIIQKGKTAAVFVEPVQGEGGVNPTTKSFLKGLRELCDERRCLLVFDEVQCGLGRTGKLWAHEHFGVEPDIMTLAKPLAGGLPIGAVLMRQGVADVMKPGDHGSTFAANPLVCSAACSVFDIVANPKFLEDVDAKGQMLKQLLRDGLKENSHLKEIRGIGLFVGIQLDQAAGDLVTKMRDEGLIVITAGDGDVIRLVPPLTVTTQEIEDGAKVLIDAVNQLQ